MARAWPRITLLSLGAGRSRHIPSRVKLEALYAFAKHCPNLFSLDMTFDATEIPDMQNPEKKSVIQQSLRVMDVALSPISEPRCVAEFLSAIFPRL
ncbi:hypothetical protein C8R44DRAFT_561445, partial [Mycena epipterygia]